jgi:dermatan 4-sulfotransferase 1
MTHRDHISREQKILILRAQLRGLTPFAKTNDNGAVICFSKHKVAYVPVPKCANSSIRAALLALIAVEPAYVEKIQEFKGFETPSIAKFMQNVYQPDWYVFTAVRNPYARYASAYLDKLVTRREPLRPLVKMGLKKSDSFLRFLRTVEKWPLRQVNEHFALQTRVLSKVLPINNLYLAKTERLDDCWHVIKERIKSISSIELPNLEIRNATKSEFSWRSLYDEQSLQLVRSIAAKDFAHFGYDLEFPE